jgi:cysteine desulfurase/selenocysteine lyase
LLKNKQFNNNNNNNNNKFIDKDFNESIKGDFIISNKKIYLNNGSVGPLPLSTIKSITDFNLRYSEQGPDSKEFNEYLDKLKIETRKRVSDLLNCSADEIIFTQSTTEGINYITNGICWKKNEKILVRNPINEHYSNYLPWIKVANDKNLKIDKFPVEKENLLLDDLKNSVNSKKPKIVTTSHIMYNNGSVTPVEEIGKILKDNNTDILFSIDGAQSVGAINVDVKKINCDFISFPAFKWICGPLGIGILYVNKKVLDNEFIPIFIGSGTAKIVKKNESKHNKNNFSDVKESKIIDNRKKVQEEIYYYNYPEKYHATFRNYPGLAGLESSLRYILRLGISNIYKKNKRLSNLFREEIIKIKDVVIHEAKEEDYRSSMICFSFKNDNNNKVVILVERLQEKGIILAEREIGIKKIVRASPHFYNTEEEIIKTTYEIKSILNQL